MTKKEWLNLRVGAKVWKQHNDLKWVGEECFSETVYKTGLVKRSNSNHSQVLVDWGDSENWYGRLGIEIIENFPKDI